MDNVRNLRQYSKTCLKRPLKNRQTKGLKTNGSLMKVKSIAECSLGALKYRQMKKVLALSLSDVVIIMLINVKLPTIVSSNIYEQDKFRAQLS